MKVCFGVDIGGTSIKMGLFSKETGLMESWEIPTKKGSDPIPLLEDVKAAMYACLTRHALSPEDVMGVGMAAPGPVSEDGLLHGTVNIGWGDVFLGEIAQRITGFSPVVIGNDARVAAFGEYAFGAGKGAKSVLMLTLGTGVGGGVIIDGKIYVGTTGAAGEIGHMCVNLFETEPCNCGKKGCLEQYASATGMVRVAKGMLHESNAPSVLREGALTAKKLWDAAKAGDALAIAITQKVSRLLGVAIANACYIVDPEMVVIGGGVSAAGDFLLDMVQDAYRKEVFLHCQNKAFALAQLRNDAGIYGAAALVFDKVL